MSKYYRSFSYYGPEKQIDDCYVEIPEYESLILHCSLTPIPSVCLSQKRATPKEEVSFISCYIIRTVTFIKGKKV